MIPDYEARFKAIESQMQTLQDAQQIQANTTMQLKAQIDSQTKQFQQHVDHKMSEQLQQIEIMLTKRSRTGE